MNLGMAFQVIDDLLDFTASESVLGKPVASDLREGKLTLPLIYLLEKNHAEERAMVQTVLEERDFRTVSRGRSSICCAGARPWSGPARWR